jgi:hypothetical protein
MEKADCDKGVSNQSEVMSGIFAELRTDVHTAPRVEARKDTPLEMGLFDHWIFRAKTIKEKAKEDAFSG